MARSQQQWRRGSQLLLVAAAVALVFLMAAGSAEACQSHETTCSWKCVDLQTDPNHCGSCDHKCVVSDHYKWGEAYCEGGACGSRCKDGQTHYPEDGECR